MNAPHLHPRVRGLAAPDTPAKALSFAYRFPAGRLARQRASPLGCALRSAVLRTRPLPLSGRCPDGLCSAIATRRQVSAGDAPDTKRSCFRESGY